MSIHLTLDQLATMRAGNLTPVVDSTERNAALVGFAKDHVEALRMLEKALAPEENPDNAPVTGVLDLDRELVWRDAAGARQFEATVVFAPNQTI